MNRALDAYYNDRQWFHGLQKRVMLQVDGGSGVGEGVGGVWGGEGARGWQGEAQRSWRGLICSSASASAAGWLLQAV